MANKLIVLIGVALSVACGGKQTGVDNPGEHLDSPIAVCGAGITFSNEVAATLDAEVKKSSVAGGLTAEFKRAARTAVELKDDGKYKDYLGCVCQQTKITSCNTDPPTE